MEISKFIFYYILLEKVTYKFVFFTCKCFEVVFLYNE